MQFLQVVRLLLLTCPQNTAWDAPIGGCFWSHTPQSGKSLSFLSNLLPFPSLHFPPNQPLSNTRHKTYLFLKDFGPAFRHQAEILFH